MPGDQITVSVGGQKKRTVTSSNGKWSVVLDPLKAGGPYELSVSGANKRYVYKDVLAGEVWLCSGQSNMAFQLEKSDGGKQEIVSATNKNIRFVLVPAVVYEGDRTRGDMNWRTATTENVGPMSGVAYFLPNNYKKN